MVNRSIKDIDDLDQGDNVKYKDLLMCARSLANEAIEKFTFEPSREDLDIAEGTDPLKTDAMDALLAEKATLTREKDIIWKEVSEEKTPLLFERSSAALDKEIKSLCDKHGVLQQVTRDDADYAMVLVEAIKGRVLLDIKRDGTVKARMVKQGFREHFPDNETFTGHVVSPISVRSAIANHIGRLKMERTGKRYKLAIIDVSTAFLQSHKFKEGEVKYVKFFNPITKETMYFKQFGPLYGEKSAPMNWEETIAPFIESLGFTRGENDRCIFFNKETGMIVLLYVDDLLLDGTEEDVDKFHDALRKRFECKELQVLQVNKPLDYLGMEVSKSIKDGQEVLSLTMSAYSKKMVEFMELDGKHHSMKPVECLYKDKMTELADDDELLSYTERKKFMTGLGMLGWLVSCIRGDLAYTHSMIASCMARPTKMAMRRLVWATRYIKGTSTYGGVTDEKMNTQTSQWRHFSDSDQGKDQSSTNKGKSRCGQISLANGFPVYFKSKATSVAMAHPDIGEGHADVSSAACEIYAAAQSTFALLYLSYCAEEMGIAFEKPSVLEMDNHASEVFTNNSAISTKLRHIDQRQHWVKTLRDKNIIRAKHVGTKKNIADIFTKPLEGEAFRSIRDMFLHDCTDICVQGGISMLEPMK